MKIIKTVGLAVFKNKKMLMAKTDSSGDAYYMVGGTIEKGEAEIDALIRETKEETGVDIGRETITFLGTFTAPAHNFTNTKVQMALYTGSISGEPTPSMEISDLHYFDYQKGMENPPELSKIIFQWLFEKGYIV